MLGMQYTNPNFSVGSTTVATGAYAHGGGAGRGGGRQLPTSRRRAAVAARGSGGSRGGGDEEIEREHERRMVAKRPDLNDLDVPEWAELALDKVDGRASSARQRPGHRETGGVRTAASG
jgi:hypothetical protein